MDVKWKKVGEKIAEFAPLVGTALGGAPGAALGALVAKTLGVPGTPADVEKAILDPAGRQKIIELELAQKTRFEELYWAAVQGQTVQTGETYRTELKSEDPYVRRARPGFIYAMKWTWILQIGTSMLAALIVVVADVLGTAGFDAADILRAIASFQADTAMQWAVALSVIGIYNIKRSDDKQVEATGQPAQGIVQMLLSRKRPS
jgi:hypothetical protein